MAYHIASLQKITGLAPRSHRRARESPPSMPVSGTRSTYSKLHSGHAVNALVSCYTDRHVSRHARCTKRCVPWHKQGAMSSPPAPPSAAASAPPLEERQILGRWWWTQSRQAFERSREEEGAGRKRRKGTREGGRECDKDA